MKQILGIFFLLVVCSACNLGPNFHPLPSPTEVNYTRDAIEKNRASGLSVPYFKLNQELSSSWWTVFHSKSLNALIQEGLKNNPSLDMSKASLEAARDNLQVVIGPSLFPTVKGQLGAKKQKTNLLAEGINQPDVAGQKPLFTTESPYNLFNASVGVSYYFDLFGYTRRQWEALQADIEYHYFEWEATYLTLTANIVTTAVMVASLNEQIHLTEDLIKTQRKILKIGEANFKLGHSNQMQVLIYKNDLTAALASLPPLKMNLAKKMNALAILVGKPPSKGAYFHLQLSQIQSPRELPLTLPSRLVQQRPDIRSAEALLHKASAEIGVATADLFPKLMIAANYGWDGPQISQIFSPSNLVWNYGTQMMQTVFQGGGALAKRRVAMDHFNHASAHYRQVVLNSFQSVADVLAALDHDAVMLETEYGAEKDALENFKLMNVRYQLGKADLIQFLSAHKLYLEAQMAVVKAKTMRHTDTAALFQALGGGWWARSKSLEFDVQAMTG